MFSAKTLATLATIYSVVQGSPVPDTDTGVDVFERDVPLKARDMELANLHNVNLTQMYKHSVYRRTDGDHVTIWVNKSFQPADESEVDLEARAVRVVGLRAGGGSDVCSSSSFNSRTGPNGPFTGGVLQLASWGNVNSGSFSTSSNDWESLVIAGSNSGYNAVFSARSQATGDFIAWIGTHNIRDLARDTERRFKRDLGGWRAAADGTLPCQANRFVFPGPINIPTTRNMQWSILRTTASA